MAINPCTVGGLQSYKIGLAAAETLKCIVHTIVFVIGTGSPANWRWILTSNGL